MKNTLTMVLDISRLIHTYIHTYIHTCVRQNYVKKGGHWLKKLCSLFYISDKEVYEYLITCRRGEFLA